MQGQHNCVSKYQENGNALQTANKKRILDVAQLKPGDHISVFNRVLSNSYHGIIREVHARHLVVIHYFKTVESVWDSLIRGSVYVTEVIQSEWEVRMNGDDEEFYVYHYDEDKYFSNEKTLERAIQQLGKRGYSLVGNNSEHWARWCRSGDSYSERVIKLHNLVKDKAATLLIVDPQASLVQDMAVVGTQGLSSYLGVIGSGVCFTTVASVSTFINIKRKRNERRQGDLSDIAFKKYVVRRISSTSGVVIGRTAGTIIGTILIPVPILGSIVGSVIGTVSGKIIGGLSGLAISKVVEIHETHKQEMIDRMKTIPQLLAELSPDSRFLQGLSRFSLTHEQVVEVDTNADRSAIYPLFEQLFRNYWSWTNEDYQITRQLSETIFVDSHTFDYFILVPLPDDNSPEQFASVADLLVLRWPIEHPQPWMLEEDNVLDISDENTRNASDSS